MRGPDHQQSTMFSYLSPEQRVPADYPLRAVRQMADTILAQLSQLFSKMYSDIGRRSIPPEKLLRALLLQVLYTVRSERMLMEQLEYNLLFRWFVGPRRADITLERVRHLRAQGLSFREIARQLHAGYGTVHGGSWNESDSTISADT